jgi:hypothetical protein
MGRGLGARCWLGEGIEVNGCSGWNPYQGCAAGESLAERRDSTIGLAGAKLPAGAVELSDVEDLSVVRALCAESEAEWP